MHWIYAHLIGDFLIQNDWMARNKKRSTPICLIHILTYILPFIFTGLIWWQIILIAIEHFIQDRTYIINMFMKVMGKNEFATGPLSFCYHNARISKQP